MSVNTMEKILWGFCEEPEQVTAFFQDPDGYLRQFPLTDEEFNMMRSVDVKAIGEYGVSNMLGLMSWNALFGNNPIVMFDYLRRMNNGVLPNNMQLPGWQFKILRFAIGVRNFWLRAMTVIGLKKSFN